MWAIEEINKIREFFFIRQRRLPLGTQKYGSFLIGLMGRSNGDGRKLIKTAEMVRAKSHWKSTNQRGMEPKVKKASIQSNKNK